MTNKKLFKLASLLLIGAMLLSCGACGSKEAATYNADEPLKVSMLFGDNPVSPFSSDWKVIEEIERLGDAKLDIQAVPISDINDKRKIIFNSGELPDLIGYTWSNDVSEYISSGIILPINKYEHLLPNMMKRIEEFDFEEGVNDLREMDGNYYVLPQMKDTANQNLCLTLRKDIFEKNNIAIPTTYEELYQSLKKLKEIYPDSYPMTNFGTHTQFFNALGPIFNTYGVGHPYGYAYNKAEDKWEYVPTTEGFKEMMDFTVKLSQEGLLDPESFTQDRNQWVQKLVTSTSFVTYGYYESTTQINQDGKKVGGEDFNIVPVLPVAGTDGQIRVTNAERGKGASVAISAAAAKRPDFERFMKFVDWLYFSEEGIKLNQLGIEGVTYNEKDGVYTRPDDIITGANPNGTLSLGKNFGVGNNNLSIVSYSKYSIGKPEDQVEYNNKLAEGNWIMDATPTLLISDEDKGEWNILTQKLNDNAERAIYDFVFGNRDMSDWDKYVKEAEKLGSKRLVEILNTNWKNNRVK